MGKKLKRAYKKLAKYERENNSLLENIKRLQIVLELEKKSLRECRTALQDLKNALVAPNATKWYENRINCLEEVISAGVATGTSYGSMAGQNRNLSKEVRELRLAVYGTIKQKKDIEK